MSEMSEGEFLEDNNFLNWKKQFKMNDKCS